MKNRECERKSLSRSPLTNVLEFENTIKDKAGVVEAVVNPYLRRFLNVGKKKRRDQVSPRRLGDTFNVKQELVYSAEDFLHARRKISHRIYESKFLLPAATISNTRARIFIFPLGFELNETS